MLEEADPVSTFVSQLNELACGVMYVMPDLIRVGQRSLRVSEFVLIKFIINQSSISVSTQCHIQPEHPQRRSVEPSWLIPRSM